MNPEKYNKTGKKQKMNLYCFNFVSHASFLFAVSDADALRTIIEILCNTVIPERRLESIDSESNQAVHPIAQAAGSG
jgi:hypothetical protein